MKYTMLLYAKRKEDREMILKFGDIGDLRWHLFSKHQQETDLLPPTPAALKFHIKRAAYVCGTLKMLIYNYTPEFPQFEDCGWEIKDNKLYPLMTDVLPAPEFSKFNRTQFIQL